MQKGVVRKRSGGNVSEYGRQLQEKQELKRQYNLRERQFSRYIRESLEKRAQTVPSAERLIRVLEKRLDNAVYRMGLAKTRNQARQMVSHGHFQVNGKNLDIPSYQVKKGDVISIHPSSVKSNLFTTALLELKKYEAPSWIQLNKEKLEATITGEPVLDEVSPTVEIPLIFEYYSR